MRHPFRSRLVHGPAPLNAIVLAGDPDHDARLVILSALTHAGYRVRIANTGDDLLREALGEGVDLVITEVGVQMQNGDRSIPALKLAPELKNIPVIAYSPSSAPADEAWARAAGADAFLRNPGNFAELFDTIAHLLGAEGLEEPRSQALIPPQETGSFLH